jgi:hypothetical protein
MRPLLLALLLLPSLALAQQIPGYEQILVPFDSMTLESGGARWHAELWARNDGASAINLFPDVCYSFGQPFPCDRRIDVPAGQTVLLDVFALPSAEYPGVLLYVPRGRSGDVTFNLRIRDLNRGADAIGTEIPVVRQEGLKTGTATLINVPLSPNGRIDLRLYVPDPVGGFTVRMYAEATGALLGQRTFVMGLPTDPPYPLIVPMTINASDIFRGWVADRVRVTIERTLGADRPFWPLLTITNQRNNQITVISPQ